MAREVFLHCPVQSVACGSCHTLVVTAEGSVWSCGSNGNGQLGLGHTSDREVFVRLHAIGSVVMAACGSHHSVVATAEGRVWTWGCGYDGRLGHADDQDMKLLPALVGGSCDPAEHFHRAKIAMVAAGGFHTVAVEEGGNGMWVWGGGAYGQLGLGDRKDKFLPTRLEAADAFQQTGNIQMASCGRLHTLTVTKQVCTMYVYH